MNQHLINEKAAKVFELCIRIVKGQQAEGKEQFYRIDRKPGVYMPLSVEKIGQIDKVIELWSFCHYGEQNGDLMRDPDIVLARIVAGERFYFCPASYRNDYLGIEQEVFIYRGGSVSGFRPKLQRSISLFCNTWAENIMDQQELKVLEGVLLA
jgi:hypothetical protein